MRGLKARSIKSTPIRQISSVPENSFFDCIDRDMQPEIHRSATTYGVQNSISDRLRTCHLSSQSRPLCPEVGIKCVLRWRIISGWVKTEACFSLTKPILRTAEHGET